MAPENIRLHAKTIAIIGSGPSGLIAAKYLRAEKVSDKIVIFEQRSRSGGVWNYTPDQTSEELFTVPQTCPIGQNQKPTWVNTPLRSNGTNGTNGTHREASFLSPMYEDLETNIPRGLMGFSDLDWPSDSQLFPRHETVLEYIQKYGKDVQDLIHYSTQVVNASPTNPTAPDTKWTIRTLDLASNTEKEEIFDALIVANGHFITPYIPDIPGLKEWHAAYPKSITHSKYFRRPQDYHSKKVIVVGNSASGSDISNQISRHCAAPLLWSTRSVSLFSNTHSAGNDDALRVNYPPIAHFHPEDRIVEFSDGTCATDIDAIVFATGYFYSLPFLSQLTPPLITSGAYVYGTYKHLFHATHPTLSFLALPQRVIPFPIAEAQAAVLARVYASRLTLPPTSTMTAWELERRAKVERERDFHLLPFPEDGEYINEMAGWAGEARVKEGLEQDGRGKEPPRWGEWEFWCREAFPRIRRAFGEVGEGRGRVRGVEELGFVFEGGKGRCGGQGV